MFHSPAGFGSQNCVGQILGQAWLLFHVQVNSSNTYLANPALARGCFKHRCNQLAEWVKIFPIFLWRAMFLNCNSKNADCLTEFKIIKKKSNNWFKIDGDMKWWRKSWFCLVVEVHQGGSETNVAPSSSSESTICQGGWQYFPVHQWLGLRHFHFWEQVLRAMTRGVLFSEDKGYCCFWWLKVY